MLDSQRMSTDSVTHSFNDKGVSRTAPTKPGLLLNVTFVHERKTASKIFQMVSVNLHASEGSCSAESFTGLHISSSGKESHDERK